MPNDFDTTPSVQPLSGFTGFTDQNGFYSIPDLEFGIYNVSVLWAFLTESTFRLKVMPPMFRNSLCGRNANMTLVSTVWSRSQRCWSESRRLGRPGTKRNDGIGAGFKYGSTTRIIYNTVP